MSGTPWGGIVSLLVGGAVNKAASNVSRDYQNVGREALGPVTSTSKNLEDWAKNDWAKFQANYAPVQKGLATNALQRGPEYEKATGKVSAEVAGQAANANQALSSGLTHGVSPGSGSAHAGMTDIAGGAASTEGAGFGMARTGEDNRVFGNRLDVVNSNKGIPNQSNVMGSKIMDMENLGARRYLGLSDSYNSAINAGASAAGSGVGKLAGYFAGGKNTTDTGNAPTNSTYGEGGDYGYGTDSGKEGWAEGGLIRGPGTGRSDSIPAKVDNSMPAKVSNGERLIPANVVRYFGTKYFDGLQAKYGKGAYA